jgi:protein-tyrosine-phosphatase
MPFTGPLANPGSQDKSELQGADRKASQPRIIFVPPVPDLTARQRVLTAIGATEGDSDDSKSDKTWPVTCQVKIDMFPSSHPKYAVRPGWLLTSIDGDGNEKVAGGDEYYITYTAKGGGSTDATSRSHKTMEEKEDQDPNHTCYSAVAIVEDLNNGAYWLDFCATPTSPQVPPQEVGGTLTIYFQYTCAIGTMAPPTKQAWSNGSYTHTKYDTDLKHLSRPPTRPFRHPNCGFTPDPGVRSQRGSRASLNIETSTQIDLKKFDLIVALGDSTMLQLVRQRPSQKGKYFFQDNLCYAEKVSFALNSQTVSSFLDMLEQGSGMHLRNVKDFPRRAVMVGSAMWDILDSKDTLQGTQYKDHQEACRTLIRKIRLSYPDVNILWKSPTAVHIHVVDLDRMVVSNMGEAALFGIERIRYMSSSRSKYLYDIQEALVMDEQRRHGIDAVTFLDLYEATLLSADWLFPSDGRHYRPDLNRLMLQWFYPAGGSTGIERQSVSVVGDGKGGKLLDIPKPYYVDRTLA